MHKNTMILRLTTGAMFAALVFGSLPVAGDQFGCTEPEKNMQCNDFGTIQMDSQRSIKGEVIDLTATVTLNTNYQDQGARWVLFSVRNVEEDGSDPVTIRMVRFGSSAGDIVTTRVEHDKPSELNLWVDTLDLPVGEPITLEMQIGATERGAFKVETLVLAFDRGYSPIKNADGTDASLFSFTLLGVNKETAPVASGGGDLGSGKKLPGLSLIPVLAAVALSAALVTRRRMK